MYGYTIVAKVYKKFYFISIPQCRRSQGDKDGQPPFKKETEEARM